MANVFDDDDERFLVLVNQEGQYSLWPEFRGVPAGWSIARAAASRAQAMAWVDEHWTETIHDVRIS